MNFPSSLAESNVGSCDTNISNSSGEVTLYCGAFALAPSTRYSSGASNPQFSNNWMMSLFIINLLGKKHIFELNPIPA